MIKNSKIWVYLSLLITFAFTNSCSKDDNKVKKMTPVLSTYDVQNIKETNATCGGYIASDGGFPIIERGICWGSSPDPVLYEKKISVGEGIGDFNCEISGLSPNKTYFAWAYAINRAGTWYGNTVMFTTIIGQVSIKTAAVSNITVISAVSGGTIDYDGGVPITMRGVCWSTSQNPTISGSLTKDGPGTGSFTSLITGLTPNTKYFVRAYATNITGTTYGDEISFTTNSLSIGVGYQGGIIAYILQPGDPGYKPGEVHGLIAAPADQSTGIQWYNGNYIITGATGTTLGTGNSNTVAIVNSQGPGNYAAMLCNDLVLNGYDDWYLPSTGELYILYINRTAIGGFSTNNNYWTSTEFDVTNAFFLDFNNGNLPWTDKASQWRVRAIRSF